MKNCFELTTFQWTMNRFPANLLPPCPSFLITHDEILVIDSRKMKVQYPSIDCCFPHQTGVTERSISGHDRRTTDRVPHQMMISHQPYWISNRLGANHDS